MALSSTFFQPTTPLMPHQATPTYHIDMERLLESTQSDQDFKNEGYSKEIHAIQMKIKDDYLTIDVARPYEKYALKKIAQNLEILDNQYELSNKMQARASLIKFKINTSHKKAR